MFDGTIDRRDEVLPMPWPSVEDTSKASEHIRRDRESKRRSRIKVKPCAAIGCNIPRTISYKSVWCNPHTLAILFAGATPPPRTRWQAWRRKRAER